jgi:oligoendopeptidase F
MAEGSGGTRRARKPALGTLPRWDLSDLYPGRDSPELQRDLARSEDEARAFNARHAQKLAGLSGAELGAAIAAYERLGETLGRIMSYASLVHAGDMSDPEIGRFYQTTHERVNDIETQLLFFVLELNRIDDAALDQKMAAPELAHYAPWLRDVRAFRPYQLSDEIEKLLHEKSVAGVAAWVRLFDETEAGLRFRVKGRSLTSAETLHLLSDASPATRKAAAKALGEVFEKNARLFALVTNTLAKDKEVEDRWRGFKRPISSRNLSNFVEDEVVDALIVAVRQSYPRLSHRYYRLKAKWFGVEQLPYWDRNAPLPDEDDTTIKPSRPTWRRSAGASSSGRGSTPRCSPANPRAPSPIRRCRARTPICCSITRARRAT